MTNPTEPVHNAEWVPFKAETRQLLDILINSLYTEREVFLRELISNASDALTRINFEMLTNRDVVDPEAELAIRVVPDAEKKLLIIKDTGIGMTRDELAENLGTIAHSGARAFINEVSKENSNITDLIGQFGVGFYSAFMVADWIQVRSRSYRPDAEPVSWFSRGDDTYTIQPDDKQDRGTEIVIKLKEDSEEFTQEYRLQEIIRRHSNYVPFPVYVGDQSESINRQSSIWRQQPRHVEDQKYLDFYKQLTLDTDEPLTRLHLSIDAPVQMYALLYVPVSVERNIFSPRKQDGLSLYARKVLIQEYNTDLLPEYLRFVVGVVDSEDIPLNVSREAVQSSRIMSQLKRLLTSKTLDHLNSLASDQPEKYAKFWSTFGRFVKEGLALDRENTQSFLPLLRYHTLQKPDEWVSLSDYVQAMKDDQKKIYYILGDDERSVINSPHLEVFKRGGYDVLLMTDPADPFGLLHFTQYADYDLANAASDQPDLLQPSGSESESGDDLSQEARDDLIERFKQQLGDRVTGVQTTTRLVESPARLVDAEGALNAEMQRVYRMMNREYEAPQKQIEINPQHPILKRLSSLPLEDARNALIIEQVYEDALLIEGLHPDPASMIARIQKIMEAALGNEE